MYIYIYIKKFFFFILLDPSVARSQPFPVTNHLVFMISLKCEYRKLIEGLAKLSKTVRIASNFQSHRFRKWFKFPLQ
jgi:hypothetical protein